MIQRSIALAAALTFAASAVAQAAPLPAASATIVKASMASASTQTAWSDPPAKSAPGKLALAEATPSATTTAPSAPTTNASDVVSKTPATSPKPVANEEPVAVSPQSAPKNTALASKTDRPASKPRDYRSAKYAGGEGGSWKTGRNSYGFSGSFGGCRFTGFAGPNGYKLDRVC